MLGMGYDTDVSLTLRVIQADGKEKTFTTRQEEGRFWLGLINFIRRILGLSYTTK